MIRAVQRRYRVRFAFRDAASISDSQVEFALDVPELGAAPVVAGSFVHPLQGATEMRPLHVRGVDRAGALIQAFAEAGRWAVLGRIVDIQWQDASDDPLYDPWTTFGTGRCSGLDELDGPGLFRVEISDETWVVRSGALFTVGGTTQLWPAGLRYPWRGLFPAPLGNANKVATQGDLYKIDVDCIGCTPGTCRRLRFKVSSDLIRY
ncbi:MAG: hypothetical protein L0271_24885, partial [Gemmatimonadetes bacterium]|nr:hypothetical protein [Gemmatimonadota bacterium]